MVLLLDNQDSFTYNLAQGLETLGAVVAVRRGDTGSLAELRSLRPSHLVVSPGPGKPQEHPLALAAIEAFQGRIPVLGVCLGHQCLAQFLGGRVVASPKRMHGKASKVHHDGLGLFAGVPDPFDAGRYHSLAVDRASLPPRALVCAWTEEGEVMGLRDAVSGAQGVQFHPESILTPVGQQILSNFLAAA